MSGVLSGALVLAMVGIPFFAPTHSEIDLSQAVNNPAGYLPDSAEDFFTDHVSRFNDANDTQVSIAYVSNMEEFSRPKGYAEYLFELDGERAAGQDKRVLLLVCVQPKTPVSGRVISPGTEVQIHVYLLVGDALAGKLTRTETISIIQGMRDLITSKQGVTEAMRYALKEVFTEINPEYNTDVASASLSETSRSDRYMFWVRTFAVGLIVLVLYRVTSLARDLRNKRTDAPYGRLTPKQMFSRMSRGN